MREISIDLPVKKGHLLLSKTQIRGTFKNKKSDFCIPLNLINPYYSFSRCVSPLILLLGLYSLLAVITRTYQWLNDSSLFNFIGQIQLLTHAIVFLFCIYYILTFKGSFKFNSLRDDSTLFHILQSKQNKKNIQKFVEEISKRAKDSTPNNEHTLCLLRDYSLVTRLEFTQLEARIIENEKASFMQDNVMSLVK